MCIDRFDHAANYNFRLSGKWGFAGLMFTFIYYPFSVIVANVK